MLAKFLLNMIYYNGFLLNFLFLVTTHFIAANSSDNEDDNNPYIEDLQCYSLSYGAWGLAFRLITFHTITMQCFQRQPLLPPRGDLTHTGGP